VDIRDLKSRGRKAVPVRVRQRAPILPSSANAEVEPQTRRCVAILITLRLNQKRKTAMRMTAAAALIASMFVVTGCEALIGGAVGAGATGGGYELHLDQNKKKVQE